MPTTELQRLQARIKQEYIMEHGFNPRTEKLSDLPDCAFECFWLTISTYKTVYEARKHKTPEQRIVRKPSAKFPAIVICKITGRYYHVFDFPFANLKGRPELREKLEELHYLAIRQLKDSSHEKFGVA